jgi:murein DD-endopeptidase MepM/ murein hydrolase activator NlpD
LDGAPRIVIGVLGDPRQHGQRVHAGIDLLASEGESVRALRAGVVISAGVDLGARGLLDMPPEQAAKVPLSKMGARGLFVRIEHADGLISLYAHLGHYQVQVGDWIDRGQRIGDVGRTGVQTSDAHLHLGIFEQDRVVDPLAMLAPYVIFVEATP